jgi:hypothetical protein
MSDHITMSVRQINEQRAKFRCGPNASGESLPLREKQALIDEMFRGMPIRKLAYKETTLPGGEQVYMVTAGWPQLQAIFDFLDDKFPTWTDEERQAYQRGEE